MYIYIYICMEPLVKVGFETASSWISRERFGSEVQGSGFGCFIE